MTEERGRYDADIARCNGLHHVNVRVPAEEIAALTVFYNEAIGLRVGPRPPFGSPGVWLYAGERAVVHLSQCRPGETLPPPAERRSSVSHVALGCMGFAATVQRLESRGLAFRVTEVPLTRERQIFLSDPSGVGVELIFPLDEVASSR
ncbi:MAG TPA: VOC family protein [Gammaproteobacteria bacterium]